MEIEAELDEANIPRAGIYLWLIYQRLRKRKGGNGFSANPIEWPDIEAFMRTTRTWLAAWEIEILEDFDDVYMAEQARVTSAQLPPLPGM